MTDLDGVIRRFRGVSLGVPTATSDSPATDKKSPYIYCDSKSDVDKLMEHIVSLKEKSSTEDKVSIYLDCEGDDLGNVGGKLGLVQLGVESEIYLVDVVTYPQSIATLKRILEDPFLQKVVWDGRSDYSELWHGHGIAMEPVLDLQLVRIYQVCDGRAGSNGFIKLEGMSRVFENLSYYIRRASGVDTMRLARVHEIVKAKHLRDETDFWIQRPLSHELRDYASFDIMQLKVLHKSMESKIARLPHITAESQRYAELRKDSRPIRGSLFFNHGILPQEILERSAANKATDKTLGTRECRGCLRELHQESFQDPFSRSRKPQLCHTCRERQRWSTYRRF